MSSIVTTSSGSKYTDEDRRNVVVHYAVLGNFKKVSEYTGIPDNTIGHWKNHSDWWEPLLEQVRAEKKDELDATLSRTIESATQRLEQRIDLGDAFITKDGDIAFKPVSARDLATVTGIIFDKRQLLRSAPTSIKAESTDARLNSLAEKVRELQGGMVTIEGKAEKVSD